ncbi:MAG: hypothetical protein HFI38_13115 [Lachnospiraceae bacterium]|jgi:hypothetical protein|nr:hypothetical protein [Lachnospiraceae bacterium]
MDSKKINRIWTASLLVLGVVTVILTGAETVNIHLSDEAVRTLGILDLGAFSVLLYSTIMRLNQPK